jgi:hypothetical protein
MRTIKEINKILKKQFKKFREEFGHPSKFENYDPFQNQPRVYVNGYKK